METSQTYDDNKQLSKDIVNKQHPSCPHSGGMHFAPPRCKDAVYAKQKERQCFYYLKGECSKKVKVASSHTVVYPTLGQGVLDSLLVVEVAAGVAAEKDVAVVVTKSAVAHLVTHLQLASHTRLWQLRIMRKSNVLLAQQLQNRLVHPRS